jgi:F-type H+-transporting ATPase subunit beta
MATATAQQSKTTTGSIGKVIQVIGPVIDVEFSEGMPEIYNALEIKAKGAEGSFDIRVVAEVQQHIGRNQVPRFRSRSATPLSAAS